MKTGKLDRRHKGHDLFRYYAQFGHSEVDEFVKVREWCWQTWGSSCEIEILDRINKKLKWAWVNDQYNTRLYFETENEYSWFLMKWK